MKENLRIKSVSIDEIEPGETFRVKLSDSGYIVKLKNQEAIELDVGEVVGVQNTGEFSIFFEDDFVYPVDVDIFVAPKYVEEGC